MQNKQSLRYCFNGQSLATCNVNLWPLSLKRVAVVSGKS